MPSGITWTTDTMSERFVASDAKRKKAAGRALYAVAEDWLLDMKQLTPVEFGNLRASEHVGDVSISGNIIAVDIYAGGPSASYAIIVHEDLDAQHPVGQAKYIESVIMSRGPSMNKDIGSYIQLSEMF